MSDQEILPCVMCDQHHEQMLMLSCMHDPCINCAAIHYCTTQPPNSNIYVCAKCGEETQLDTSSIVELQRIYNQLKAKKKYDYRRNLGGFSQTPSQNQSYSNSNVQKPMSHYVGKTKTQPENNTVYTHQPTYSAQQQYAPISQPTYPTNPYNNVVARKAQQQMYMCETHPDQELSYFCFDCRSPICPQCAIHGTHRDHEVQTTRKSIKLIKSNLAECQEALSAQVNNTAIVKDNWRAKSRDLGQQHKKDKQLIHDQFHSLMMILQDKEKQFQRTLDHTHENNANIVKGQISECEKVIENYNGVRKNIDATVKKDELTILQEFSKREKQTKIAIDNNKGKPHSSEADGIKTIDYALFKDEMDQLSGIMQALRLTTKSHRN